MVGDRAPGSSRGWFLLLLAILNKYQGMTQTSVGNYAFEWLTTMLLQWLIILNHNQQVATMDGGDIFQPQWWHQSSYPSETGLQRKDTASKRKTKLRVSNQIAVDGVYQHRGTPRHRLNMYMNICVLTHTYIYIITCVYTQCLYGCIDIITLT